MNDPKVAAAVKVTCPKCNGKIRLNQMYVDVMKGKA